VIFNGDETDDQINGTNNNDILFGWIGNNYLREMTGDDVNPVGEGVDTIIGDISKDVLNKTIHGKDVSIVQTFVDLLQSKCQLIVVMLCRFVKHVKSM
jgi:Ca2+-binding RTX toxin-like protein